MNDKLRERIRDREQELLQQDLKLEKISISPQDFHDVVTEMPNSSGRAAKCISEPLLEPGEFVIHRELPSLSCAGAQFRVPTGSEVTEYVDSNAQIASVENEMLDKWEVHGSIKFLVLAQEIEIEIDYEKVKEADRAGYSTSHLPDEGVQVLSSGPNTGELKRQVVGASSQVTREALVGTDADPEDLVEQRIKSKISQKLMESIIEGELSTPICAFHHGKDKRMRVGTRHVRFTYVGLTSLHPTEVPL